MTDMHKSNVGSRLLYASRLTKAYGLADLASVCYYKTICGAVVPGSECTYGAFVVTCMGCIFVEFQEKLESNG